MKTKPYAILICHNCHASWDIAFTNTSASPSEYTMAIEQSVSEPCPDCGEKRLRVADDPKLNKGDQKDNGGT